MKVVSTTQGARDRTSPRRRADERGIALLVALIASVGIAFSAAGLLRAVSTQSAVGGNLAARQRTMYAATESIEQSVASLFEVRTIADTGVDDLRSNYFATYQTGANPLGVPRVLQAISNYPMNAASLDAGEGLTARYVIERLCQVSGPASRDTCTLTPSTDPISQTLPPSGESPRRPYYRVTIRIDGPAGATGFVQAILGEEASHHRLSWRMLDE